jgi:hypothetical protein
MLIKLLANVVHAMALHNKGKVIEVAEEVGADLIKRKLAAEHLQVVPAAADGKSQVANGQGGQTAGQAASSGGSAKADLLDKTIPELMQIIDDMNASAKEDGRIVVGRSATKAVIVDAILSAAGYKVEPAS